MLSRNLIATARAARVEPTAPTVVVALTEPALRTSVAAGLIVQGHHALVAVNRWCPTQFLRSAAVVVADTTFLGHVDVRSYLALAGAPLVAIDDGNARGRIVMTALEPAARFAGAFDVDDLVTATLYVAERRH